MELKKVRRVKKLSLPRPLETAAPVQPQLRVGFIPGVEPDVFARRWRSNPNRPLLELFSIQFHEQESALSDKADLVFARLPLSAETEAKVHVVKLWKEKATAIFSSEHHLSLYEELTTKELVAETQFAHPYTPKELAQIVASGVGYALLPMSLARLHQRKDITYRIVNDLSPTQIALIWLKECDNELIQEFVAVVRGRGSNSSR